MANKYRVPVLVDRGQYDQVKRYAEITGTSVASVVRQALQDFIDTVVETKLESLTETSASNFDESVARYLDSKAAFEESKEQTGKLIPFHVSGVGNA